MKGTALISALAAVFVVSGAPPKVDAAGYIPLAVATGGELGQYLVDAEGRSVYLFEADTQGTGGQQAVSGCYDACAEAWPPLIAGAAFDPGVNLVGTAPRNDGTMQVTYNGWPVYYYVKDRAPGQTTGHDIEDFGAEWYLLTPDGEKVGEGANQAQGEGQAQGQSY